MQRCRGAEDHLAAHGCRKHLLLIVLGNMVVVNSATRPCWLKSCTRCGPAFADPCPCVARGGLMACAVGKAARHAAGRLPGCLCSSVLRTLGFTLDWPDTCPLGHAWGGERMPDACAGALWGGSSGGGGSGPGEACIPSRPIPTPPASPCKPKTTPPRRLARAHPRLCTPPSLAPPRALLTCKR